MVKCKNFSFNSMFWIPDYMEDGIENYINYGLEPGGFLTAIICNDLKSAVMRADGQNIGNIPAYVAYFYNHAPIDCWGSYDLMVKWCEKGGLNG